MELMVKTERMAKMEQIGTNGIDGQDGYTPVRGTDYWTSQDIATIEAYCDNYIDANITQVLGGSY